MKYGVVTYSQADKVIVRGTDDHAYYFDPREYSKVINGDFVTFKHDLANTSPHQRRGKDIDPVSASLALWKIIRTLQEKGIEVPT